MYIKLFPHGKSLGKQAVNYLIRLDYAGRDQSPPQVLRGDPELTKNLIDSQERIWKYSAGVISWSEKDISPEQEQKFMQDFEKLAFAGLKEDQFNILWVRHSHANHHELHFVTPRVELYTGKAFNAFPPNWQKSFDVLRDLYNVQNGWTRPDDPKRARICTPAKAELKYNRLKRWGKNIAKDETDQLRGLLINYILQRIENGQVQDRNDIIQSFEEIGLDINRKGKDYITVQNSASNCKIRLKGGIFCEHWRIESENTATSKDRSGEYGESRTAMLKRLSAELSQVCAKHAEYNRGRYGKLESQCPDLELFHLKSLDEKLHSRNSGFYGATRGEQWFNIISEQQSAELTNQYPEFESRNSGRRTDLSGDAEQNMGLEPVCESERQIYNSSLWSQTSHRLDNRQKSSHKTGVEYERNAQTFDREFGKVGSRKQTEHRQFTSSDQRHSPQTARFEQVYFRFKQLVHELADLVPRFAKYYEQARAMKTKKQIINMEIER